MIAATVAVSQVAYAQESPTATFSNTNGMALAAEPEPGGTILD